MKRPLAALIPVIAMSMMVLTACSSDPEQTSSPSPSSSPSAESVEGSDSATAEPFAAESSTAALTKFESLPGPKGAKLFTSLDSTHTLAIGKDWVLEEPADLATWAVPLKNGGSTRVNIIPEAGQSDQGMKSYLDYAIESIRGSVDKLTVLDTEITIDAAGHELGRLDVRATANGRPIKATSFVKIFGDTAYTVGLYTDPADHAGALKQLESYLVTLSAAG